MHIENSTHYVPDKDIFAKHDNKYVITQPYKLSMIKVKESILDKVTSLASYSVAGT